MGLFMGISLLSFAELVYFLTIRPVCNWLMRKREQRQVENAKPKWIVRGRPTYKQTRNEFIFRYENEKKNGILVGNGPNGIQFLN